MKINLRIFANPIAIGSAGNYFFEFLEPPYKKISVPDSYRVSGYFDFCITSLSNQFLFFLFLFPFSSFSQTGKPLCKQFMELSRPEKRWVAFHPFVAKKAWKISVHAKEVADKIKTDTLLDGDIAGGQADAFRHAFWMASLSQKIYWRKAHKLGKAHEKGNKIDFKKRKKEDTFLPDKASVEMDLFNNRYGILLGKENKNISEEETVQIIFKAIFNGELKVIKKDSQGNSLDENGNIITNWMGKWENGRVLAGSDYKKQ